MALTMINIAKTAWTIDGFNNSAQHRRPLAHFKGRIRAMLSRQTEYSAVIIRNVTVSTGEDLSLLLDVFDSGCNPLMGANCKVFDVTDIWFDEWDVLAHCTVAWLEARGKTTRWQAPVLQTWRSIMIMRDCGVHRNVIQFINEITFTAAKLM